MEYDLPDTVVRWILKRQVVSILHLILQEGLRFDHTLERLRDGGVPRARDTLERVHGVFRQRARRRK
jgi:hypothetical protein